MDLWYAQNIESLNKDELLRQEQRVYGTIPLNAMKRGDTELTFSLKAKHLIDKCFPGQIRRINHQHRERFCGSTRGPTFSWDAGFERLSSGSSSCRDEAGKKYPPTLRPCSIISIQAEGKAFLTELRFDNSVTNVDCKNAKVLFI